MQVPLSAEGLDRQGKTSRQEPEEEPLATEKRLKLLTDALYILRFTNTRLAHHTPVHGQKRNGGMHPELSAMHCVARRPRSHDQLSTLGTNTRIPLHNRCTATNIRRFRCGTVGTCGHGTQRDE